MIFIFLTEHNYNMAGVAAKILKTKVGQNIAKGVVSNVLNSESGKNVLNSETGKRLLSNENEALSQVVGKTLAQIIQEVGNDGLNLTGRAVYHTADNVVPRIGETVGRVASELTTKTGNVMSKTADIAGDVTGKAVDTATGAISKTVDKATGAISQTADTATSAVSHVATGTGMGFLTVLKGIVTGLTALFILAMIVLLIVWLAGGTIFGKSLKEPPAKTRDDYTVDTGLSEVGFDKSKEEKYKGPLGLFIYVWDSLMETMNEGLMPLFNVYSDLTVGTMASWNMSMFGKMNVDDIPEDKKSIRSDFKEGRCNDVDNVTGANSNQCISSVKSNKITWRLNSIDQKDNRRLPPDMRKEDMTSITVEFKPHESGLYIPDCSSSYYTKLGKNAKTNILENAGMNSDKTGFRCKIVKQSPLFKGFSGNKQLRNYNRVDSY